MEIQKTALVAVEMEQSLAEYPLQNVARLSLMPHHVLCAYGVSNTWWETQQDGGAIRTKDVVWFTDNQAAVALFYKGYYLIMQNTMMEMGVEDILMKSSYSVKYSVYHTIHYSLVTLD